MVQLFLCVWGNWHHREYRRFKRGTVHNSVTTPTKRQTTKAKEIERERKKEIVHQVRVSQHLEAMYILHYSCWATIPNNYAAKKIFQCIIWNIYHRLQKVNGRRTRSSSSSLCTGLWSDGIGGAWICGRFFFKNINEIGITVARKYYSKCYIYHSMYPLSIRFGTLMCIGTQLGRTEMSTYT